MEAEAGGREVATGGRVTVAEIKIIPTVAAAETAEAVNPVVSLRVRVRDKVEVVEAPVILTNLHMKPAPCTGNTGNRVTFVVILMFVLGSTRLSRGRKKINEPVTSSVLKIIKSTTSFCSKL